NGIAMLTGVDPLGIAATVYLVVMWNTLLFLVAMYRHDRLPSLPASLDREATIIGRALVWVGLWAVGAVLLAWFRDDLPSAWWLLATLFALAALYIARGWGPPRPPAAATFAGMWNNRRGYVRVACFVGVFLILSAIADLGQSARWVGWASALPLPGIFALAMLSATERKEDLLALGDTVLLGPLLVIPFTWLLARAVVELRLEHAGTPAQIATVVAFWAAAAAIVFILVPPFARWRDRLAA